MKNLGLVLTAFFIWLFHPIQLLVIHCKRYRLIVVALFINIPMFPLFGFSQSTQDHNKESRSKVHDKKDAKVKVIDAFRRDNGSGKAIIIQRHRNDAVADKLVQKYIAKTRKELSQTGLGKQITSSDCSNLDFEDGNFTSWTGQTGVNSGYPAGSWVNGIVAGSHSIVTSGSDPYATAANPISLPAPGGGAYSIKLGNNDVSNVSGGYAEQLIYTFTVQSIDTNFIYKYAVVLEDPQHTPPEQPYFDFTILDPSGNNISCSYQHYVAGSGLYGFLPSQTTDVYFKPWTTVGINLAPYLGQQITIMATTADCSQGAHFGYAYLDFVCLSNTSSTTTYCDNQTSAVITAPTVEPSMAFTWSTGETTSSITINPQLYNDSIINCFVESPTSVGFCGFWYTFPIHVVELTPDFTFSSNCLTVNFTDSSSINGGSLQSWLWNFGDGNTATAQNTSHTYSTAGSYNVTLTINSANGCQKTVNQSVTIASAAITLSSTNLQCFGDNNATATVTTTGDPPSSIVWTPSPPVGQGTNTISSLPAGTWVVQVSATNGCTSTDTIVITQPPDLVATIPTSSDILCFGGNSGSATASAIGGTGAYTYLWNTTPAQTTVAAINLIAGVWTVTVKDANMCSATDSVTLIEPTALTATTTPTSNLCFGDQTGSAIVIPNGGTPDYTYLWSNGQLTSTLSDVLAGSYSVAVTDANACTITANVTITQPVAVTATISSHTNVSCFGGSDGQATVAPAGGTGVYSYSWNTVPTQNTITATNLPVGEFTVVVTDVNLCTGSVNVTITEPPALVASTTFTNVSCFNGSDGTIDLTVIGGTLPYTFLWSNLQITQNVTGLSEGDYVSNITDAKLCTISISTSIHQPLPLTTATESVTNISCFGGSDGQACVIGDGGTPPFTYNWSANPSWNQPCASNLSAGNAVVTVVDKLGCAKTHTILLIEPDEIITSHTADQVICHNTSLTLSMITMGGTMPYLYHWNTGENTSSIVVLPDSTTSYTCYVSDGNNCVGPLQTIIVYLLPQVQLEAATYESICPEDSAEIYLSVANGVPPYLLYLDDGTVISTPYYLHSQHTETIMFHVKDKCNTTDTASVQIMVYPRPLVQPIADRYAGCSPFIVNFHEISPNEGQTYVWRFDDEDENNLSLAKNPIHLFDVAGSYDISLQVTTINGCKKDTTLYNFITVYPLPDARFVYSPEIPTIITPEVDFTNLSQDYVSNFWSFGDGDSSLQTNPNHLYNAIGDYEVVLRVITDKGCADTSIQMVHVQDYFSLYSPTAFSPDGDGKNDMFYVYGSGIMDGTFILYLYDRWGEKMYESKSIESGWDGTLKGEKVKIGTYVWMVVCKDFMGNGKIAKGTVTVIR